MITKKINFSRLEPFEIREKYPLNRFLHLGCEIKCDKKEWVLDVSLLYETHPDFSRSFIDGYKLTVIGIFPDSKKRKARTAAVELEVISLAGELAPLRVKLAGPRGSKSFVVCVRLDGCVAGKVGGVHADTGMRVIGAGAV